MQRRSVRTETPAAAAGSRDLAHNPARDAGASGKQGLGAAPEYRRSALPNWPRRDAKQLKLLTVALIYSGGPGPGARDGGTERKGPLSTAAIPRAGVRRSPAIVSKVRPDAARRSASSSPASTT